MTIITTTIIKTNSNTAVIKLQSVQAETECYVPRKEQPTPFKVKN